MSHLIRQTAAKLARRLALIEPLAYRRQWALEPLRLRALSGPDEAPPAFPARRAGLAAGDAAELLGGQDLNFALAVEFRTRRG